MLKSVRRDSAGPALNLRYVGVDTRIECASAPLLELIEHNFGELRVQPGQGAPALRYQVTQTPEGGFEIASGGGEPPLQAADTYEALYLLEKSITIDTQLVRNDLFFIHGAALGLGGYAHLLVAPSGSGKSTTAWAAVNRDFGYLSDELAAIDLRTMEVHPYPHALCLKALPPAPFEVTGAVMSTARTHHVRIPEPAVVREPLPLASITLVGYDPSAEVSVTRVSTAEAARMVYANALNPLAHPASGLSAAAAVAGHAAVYRLVTGDLEASVAAWKRQIDPSAR